MAHSAATPESTRLCRRVARNVRSMRRGRGWTLNRVAQELQLLGIPADPRELGKLERGERALVSVDDLFGFARAFGVPVSELVQQEREPAAAGG